MKKEKGSKNPKKRKNNKTQFWTQMFLTVVLLLLVTSIFTAIRDKQEEDNILSLSEVAEQINTGSVKEIVVRGDKLEVILSDDTEKEAKKEREASLTETLVNFGVTPDALANVKIELKNENGIGFYLANFLPFLFPLLFIGILIWFFLGQARGGGMKAFSFGQSKAKIVDPKDQRITFKDVAGAKEAKQELEEIVEFLKFPQKFLDIGAKIPKGVLLMGAPGTGKTLLARAVAGEAKVPFFHLSGSEFVEMFVGVGASRVRDLFNNAKKASPAIIFIDEIDAVGRSRGIGIGGGNDEREQTLNQILVEMDGFDPHEKLIVIAATNRADVLDSALLRPGRFDRRVILDIPDRKDREEILKIHARKKPLKSDVDLQLIAQRTPGFSGADLESLMNEAAILSARRDLKEVGQIEILQSIEKVMIGPERKSHLHTKDERELVAYHEAGHALVASMLPNADPVHKVSIVARGRAGGYTLKLPTSDKKLKRRAEYVDDIAMSLGGYAAEKLVYDDVTTGPSNDLQVATQMARNMVTKWGMSETLGPVALDTNTSGTMFGPGTDKREHSEKTEDTIDTEVKKLMQDGLNTALKILNEKRDALNAIVKELLEHETLERTEYNKIILKFGIEPKQDEFEGTVISESLENDSREENNSETNKKANK